MKNYSRFKQMAILIHFVIFGIMTINVSAEIRHIEIGSNSITDNNWPSSSQPNTVSTAIYTAAEISQSARPYIIAKLGLYVVNTNNPTANSFDNVYILLRNTNATIPDLPVQPCGIEGIAALENAGFVCVKGPFSIRGSQLSNGWNDLVFTTPFNYTGGNANLQLVIVSVNQQNTATGTVNGFSVGAYNSAGLSTFYSPHNYCRATSFPNQSQSVKPYLRLEIDDAYTEQVYRSSRCYQSLISAVEDGETNVNVLKVEIDIFGATGTPNNLTQMIFDGKNSLDFATNTRLYYTETSPVFNTNNQVGSEVEITSTNVNSITFDGNVSLKHGTNFFWLVYDIASDNSGYVDAALTQFTLSTGVVTNTTTKDPAGDIYIKVRNSLPKDITTINNERYGGEFYIGAPYYGTNTYIRSGLIGSRYRQGFNEYIYKRREVAEVGTNKIYNLAWQVSNVEGTFPNYMHGISVWLKNIPEDETMMENTTYPDTVNGGYIKVLDNVSVYVESCSFRDWLVFYFDEPFEYASGNLKILITKSTDIEVDGFFLNNFYSHSQYDVPSAGNVGKYGFGIGDVITDTDYSNQKPVVCFNKYENNELCTRSGIVPFDGDATRKVIRAVDVQPPYNTNSGKNIPAVTYSGSWEWNCNAMANWLYPRAAMGNYSLNNCPRVITGISFYQAYRNTNNNFYTQNSSTSLPVEIWMRNTPNNTLQTSVTNPAEYYAERRDSGFVRVFRGTFEKGPGNRKIYIDFSTDTDSEEFVYDGVSNVEVIIRSVGNTSTNPLDAPMLYHYGPTETNAYRSRGATATTTTAVLTTWSSNNNFLVPMVDWHYASSAMTIDRVSELFAPENKLSGNEYLLFGAEVSVSDYCNPYSVNSINIRLNNSDDVRVDKLKVYDRNPMEYPNAVVITTFYNPESNFIRIPVNLPLIDGRNYYWISAEINEQETNCNGTISGSLLSVTIRDNEYDARYYMPQQVAPTSVNYDPIVFANRYPTDKICYSKVDSVYTVDVRGSVGQFEWYLWRNNDWEYIKGATSNFLNIFTDDVNTSNRAKIVAIPPAGGCTNRDSLILNFAVSHPASGVYLTIGPSESLQSAPPDTFITCYEESIFVGHYDERSDISSVQWQYLDIYNRWQPVPLVDAITARNDTMYFTPNERYRNTMIRFVAYSDASCGDSAISQSFRLISYAPNMFTVQPPKTINLCKGERLYVAIAFSGETPKAAQWYKDGFPMQYDFDQVLDITSAAVTDAGSYWYRVESDGCQGPELIISDTLRVFINPDPYIISQPGVVRADTGKVALLKIEANYYHDGSRELFRWYRHYGITNTNVLLEESHSVIGTRSDILAIIPISEDDYTYNIDYYYCEISALCTPNTIIRSKPIYLQPEYRIIITHQPEDKITCDGDSYMSRVFSVYAFTDDDNTKIFYQWYEVDDNGQVTELVNNMNGYSGVNSQHLTVPVLLNGYGYYCRVWHYDDGNPYTGGVLSNTAYIRFGTPISGSYIPGDIIIPDDIILDGIANFPPDSIYIGETLNLDATENIKFSKSNIIDIKWEFQELGKPNTIRLPNTSLSLNFNSVGLYQSGRYTATITTTCETVIQTFIVVVYQHEGVTNSFVTEEEEEVNVELQISPNPAGNFVKFIFTTTADRRYDAEVTDLSGAVVYSLSGITGAYNNIELDIEKLKLTSGSYMFNLFIDGKQITKSFVIAR